MARTLYRLTDKMVRNLAAPGYHSDGGGLYLQVSKAGTKSWVDRFTRKGHSRDMGLGSLRLVSLFEARAKAGDCRAILAKGGDPIEHRRAQIEAGTPIKAAEPAAPNFRDFAEQYIDARAAAWRNSKHREQWRSTLAAYAYPIIGDMALGAIDTPDILRVLEPIWAGKSETASRVRGRIERILAAASVRGHRPAANPATWMGHLREALPPKQKSTPFAALTYTEIPVFMQTLRRRQGIAAAALEFTILTAGRSGEARGTRWPEVDEAAKAWTVPADRMKAGRPHVVPLSDRALEILEAMRPLRDLAGGFIFPGVKSGRPLSDMTLSALVRAMGFNCVPHGFRAGFKTWAEQETDFPNVVIEAALAHIVGDKAERAYMRGDWFAKRRGLMDAWGAYCTSAPRQTVVPIRRAGGAV